MPKYEVCADQDWLERTWYAVVAENKEAAEQEVQALIDGDESAAYWLDTESGPISLVFINEPVEVDYAVDELDKEVLYAPV